MQMKMIVGTRLYIRVKNVTNSLQITDEMNFQQQRQAHQLIRYSIQIHSSVHY